MRILFVSVPITTHFYPMVPLAWACRSADHDVLVATTSTVAEEVRRSGLAAVDVAPRFDVAEWEEELAEKHPDINYLSALYAHGLTFAGLNDVMAEGTLALADSWRPDVVVFSEVSVVGAMAAARLGVPAVRHNIELCDISVVVDHLAGVLASAFGHRDVPTGRAPEPAVSFTPPGMYRGNTGAWRVRCVPYNGGAVLPDWLRHAPERARIAVTEGTSTPGDHPGRLRCVIAAAERVDAEFVLAVDRAVVKQYEPLPDNVRVAGWVPLAPLLRTCRGVIHHGGTGTTTNALYAGVPQLVLPDDTPRQLTGEAVAHRGAGLTADPGDVDDALIRRLLTDDTLSRAAAEVRADMLAMPTPYDVVPKIVALT